MAWTASAIFQQYVSDMIGNVAALDYDADTINVALYNDAITPDKTVTAANSAYNAGQWAIANEQTSSTDWPAGGQALATKTNTASGANATLTVYGCLVYDGTIATPVADQGLCYNWFGGVQSVTGGTLTVVWSPSGIMSFAV